MDNLDIDENGTINLNVFGFKVVEKLKEVVTWIRNHEALTLPRCEQELIELLKTSEPLREEIMGIWQREINDEEEALYKALETLSVTPLGYHDQYHLIVPLAIHQPLMEAYRIWKEQKR